MAKESKKPLNKAGVLAHLAEAAGLGKKEVSAVLEALYELAQEQLGKKGPGVFVIPPSRRTRRAYTAGGRSAKE